MCDRGGVQKATNYGSDTTCRCVKPKTAPSSEVLFGLVRVNYFSRQNFSPFDILSEEAILKKFRLPRQVIMELLSAQTRTRTANAKKFCLKSRGPAAYCSKVLCYRELHWGRGRRLRPQQDLGVEVRPLRNQRPSAPCRGLDSTASNIKY